jgi:Ca-activated chloride channel family protein
VNASEWRDNREMDESGGSLKRSLGMAFRTAPKPSPRPSTLTLPPGSRPGISVLLLANCILLLFPCPSFARTDSVREMLREGNRLYDADQYTEAVNKYNEALVEQPNAIEPKFNKANSYYRLDDLGEAIDLYQEVAAASKDMAMVARAKYNLGDCFFQRGSKQRDSDLQKALEDMKRSITYWRQVLDIDPKNEKAARNIEVARLTIKDILDQIKQQQQNQQDPNQPQQQDPNQPQGGQRQQRDPNDPNDLRQSWNPNQQDDPNQAVQKDQVDESIRPHDSQPPDMTAQEIIDNEQRQKEGRENLQRVGYREVEKDW